MAIDKNRTKDLVAGIDEFFEASTQKLPEEARAFLKKSIMGPAFEEIHKLVHESRPPVLFLIGRSGHGKSSAINALAGKTVSEVGDIKPTTPESIPYLITFEERYSSWQVVDSRGIFETTRPDGAPDQDASDHLIEDVKKHRPDVIMHVIAAPEIRNLSNDLKLFRKVSKALKDEVGVRTPSLIVLNKADTLGNPREWPPEENARKAALIVDALDYMAGDVLGVRKRNIDLNFPIRGYEIDDDTYPGIIPICSLDGENWNVDTLSDFIGMHLPDSTLLDFFQAQRRKKQLRKISSALIKRFSVIASGVGASPIPLSDFVVLMPLQLLMLSFIGGLSCRPVSKETAYEYLSAAGLNIAAASGVRYIGQQLAKLIPYAGWATSGSLAGSATYALGKAAEAYFFAGKLEKPDDHKLDWEQVQALPDKPRELED